MRDPQSSVTERKPQTSNPKFVKVKTKSSFTPGFLKKGRNFLTNCVDKANMLNTFFSPEASATPVVYMESNDVLS